MKVSGVKMKSACACAVIASSETPPAKASLIHFISGNRPDFRDDAWSQPKGPLAMTPAAKVRPAEDHTDRPEAVCRDDADIPELRLANALTDACCGGDAVPQRHKATRIANEHVRLFLAGIGGDFHIMAALTRPLRTERRAVVFPP